MGKEVWALPWRDGSTLVDPFYSGRYPLAP
jgi:hypothetical protein